MTREQFDALGDWMSHIANHACDKIDHPLLHVSYMEAKEILVGSPMEAQSLEDLTEGLGKPLRLNPMSSAPRDGTYVVLFGLYDGEVLMSAVVRYDGGSWSDYFDDSVHYDEGELAGWLPRPLPATA